MGFSTTGAVVILSLGLMIGAATLSSSLYNASERVADARDDRAERSLARHNTAFSVSSVGYNATNNTVVVRANNTGDRTLDAARVSIVVDGEFQADPTRSVEGYQERSVWAPNQQLTIRVTVPADPDRIKLVGPRGVADVKTGV